LRGLAGKLVLLSLLAGVLPLVVFGVVAVLVARETAAGAVREGNRQVARRAAREIGNVVERARELVAAALHLAPRVGLSAEEESRLLAGFKMQFPVLARLTRVTPDGAPLAWSDAVRPPPLAAGDPALAAAARGETYTGALSTQDDLVPHLRVALPARGGGAMVATLDLLAVWRIVDDIGISGTGRLVLLDEDGAVLAHGDRRAKGLVARRERLPQLLARARAAGDSAFEGAGSLGAPSLAVGVAVPETPWLLVLEQDRAEALAGVRRLSWLLGGLIIIAAALATAGGVWLARRRILAPVRVLDRAAAEYGRGRFEHRVALDTGDELEELARAMDDMARRVAAARDELRRSERARGLGLLAGGLAHDLKHPVAAFQALLMRAERLAPEELDRRLAEAARREIPRLAAIVEQLHDLGRAGARRDVTFPAAGLAEIGDGHRARAEARGITLVVEAPPPDVELRGDRHMLGRAVDNLVANAIDASPDGGTVRLSVSANEITVEDEGAGIDEAVREQLFEGFASTKEGGLGLGLTVVQRVAESHGGGVVVEPRPGGGTRFVLRLSHGRP